MYILPAPKPSLKISFLQLFLKAKGFFRTKKDKYKLAAVLDLILIAAICYFGRQPAQELITPVVASFNTVYSLAQKKLAGETFAFVPGLARNKFDNIDLAGLTNLTFFDVPVTENGEINQYSRGYASFTSDEALDLFDRAHQQQVKIFLTLSAFDPDIITGILKNKEAQTTLADQAVAEINSAGIDGVVIDFEFPDGRGQNYQGQFTNFIKEFTSRVHSQLPEAKIAVAIPSNLTDNQSLHNIGALSKAADKIFVIAANFIVPEEKNSAPINPIFGFKADEYWANLTRYLSQIVKKVSYNKLVMERAWYGNGDNYPLYIPSSHPIAEAGLSANSVNLDQETIDSLVAEVPDKGKAAARANIPLIAKALDKEGILDSNVLAYALATIEHETDETFEPIAEIQGNISARRLGYEGGAFFYGRGFIQITHLRNYRQIGERIGMGDQLAKNPDLASKPEVAAKVLAAFFKDNNVANLASKGQFSAARTPINPDHNGYSVAHLAMKYETN